MSYNSQNPLSSILLFDKYKIISQIGNGSFGTVYSGINQSTNERVAIKCEKQINSTNCSLFHTEAKILSSLKGIKGIPQIFQYGNIKGFNIIILELLGMNLNDLFIKQHNKFSLITVCLLAIDMITLIKSIHQRKLLHRDIKPENFTIGIGKNEDTLYLIDFGLAKKYINNNGDHISLQKGENFIGTARYCSLYTHGGFEQSRRDDLESIGYVLMYFLRGSLPWEGVMEKGVDKRYETVGKVKMNTSIQELCAGFPDEMKYYFNYVRRMKFEEEPKYDFLCELFEEMIKKSVKEGIIARVKMIEWNWNLREGKKIKGKDNDNDNDKGNIKEICCKCVIF